MHINTHKLKIDPFLPNKKGGRVYYHLMIELNEALLEYLPAKVLALCMDNYGNLNMSISILYGAACHPCMASYLILIKFLGH